MRRSERPPRSATARSGTTRPIHGRRSTGRTPATGRACAPPRPLAGDDGLNFLRLGRTAPFGFHYFEVGNEEYGSWEIDHHTVQHDPATYVAFAKQFQTYAAAIDPSISIGIDAGAPDNSYNNWIPDVLQQSVTQGFTIGFISDHNYVQAPGSESDSTLLLDTVSDPSSPYDWAVRAADYTDLLNQYLGAAGRQRRAADDRVQLGLLEPGQADDQPGQRPVHRRLARRAAADVL